jgi:hypothetical protein
VDPDGATGAAVDPDGATGAAVDPDGATGAGRGYWPEVARLLRASYRSLGAAVSDPPADGR